MKVHEYKYVPWGKRQGIHYHTVEVERETKEVYQVDRTKNYNFQNCLEKYNEGRVVDGVLYLRRRNDSLARELFIARFEDQIARLYNDIDIVSRNIDKARSDIFED